MTKGEDSETAESSNMVRSLELLSCLLTLASQSVEATTTYGSVVREITVDAAKTIGTFKNLQGEQL